MKENAKSTRLGWKIWFSAIVFGLVGQIAWVVENMYFATFAQDIYTNSGNRDMAYVVTTLMVIFSAITATVTTIFAGGLCDKLGKRKVFVSYGYIAWGLTIRIHRLGAYHNVVCGNSYARRLAYSGALRLFACPVRLRYDVCGFDGIRRRVQHLDYRRYRRYKPRKSQHGFVCITRVCDGNRVYRARIAV